MFDYLDLSTSTWVLTKNKSKIARSNSTKRNTENWNSIFLSSLVGVLSFWAVKLINCSFEFFSKVQTFWSESGKEKKCLRVGAKIMFREKIELRTFKKRKKKHFFKLWQWGDKLGWIWREKAFPGKSFRQYFYLKTFRWVFFPRNSTWS